MAIRDSITAAFVGPSGQAETRNVSRPKLHEGEVMVRMEASGICGTDLEKLSGAYTASAILGHEVSGTISESNSDDWQIGQKVIPHHHVACGSCALCKLGAETMCPDFTRANFDPGGFATEFRVPRYNVERNGLHSFEKLSFDSAAFVEPLGCCLRGLLKILPAREDVTNYRNALVVGAGPIGLLHMELLRQRLPEVKITAIDVSDLRLNAAEKHENASAVNPRNIAGGLFSETARLQTSGLGFDLVIVATGNPVVFAESVRSLRKSGRLLLFGAMHKGSTYSLELQSMLLNELTFASSYATSEKEMEMALKMLIDGEINVEKFVSRHVPLARIQDGMSLARSEEQVKVIITP